MKVLANTIEDLPAGTRLVVNGVMYVRMADSERDHITGFMFDVQTGIWTHWSKHVLGQDEVEVLE